MNSLRRNDLSPSRTLDLYICDAYIYLVIVAKSFILVVSKSLLHQSLYIYVIINSILTNTSYNNLLHAHTFQMLFGFLEIAGLAINYCKGLM